MEKIISVIIPVYNVEGYLEHCLDSILQQTFKDFEVIVVDDGSSDGTPDICDDYGKRDSRIKIIHKINEGVSIARNTGIEQAKGKYILFFDGDDFMEPYTMEELVNCGEINSADTVIYGYHTFENGRVKETFLPKFKEDIYKNEKIIEELLPAFIGVSENGVDNWLKKEKNALYVENPALWRTMVSRDIIVENNIRFQEQLRVGEDTMFISEYLSCAKDVYVVKKPYYYLVLRNQSTIAVYEKDPVSKLEEKLKLVKARKLFTEKIKKEKNIDLLSAWSGTVIMSEVELAFLFSKKSSMVSKRERYHMFKTYAQDRTVRYVIKRFKLHFRPSIMWIPLMMVKYRMTFLLFIATGILNLMNFNFKRT